MYICRQCVIEDPRYVIFGKSCKEYLEKSMNREILNEERLTKGIVNNLLII